MDTSSIAPPDRYTGTIMSGKVRTINVIDVPYRQDIPGLRFRAFQGEADYVAMADLLNECLDADTIERVTSAEEIAHNFR